jgi:hypothetical protein
MGSATDADEERNLPLWTKNFLPGDLSFLASTIDLRAD